jgi:hypothetical protein
MHSNRNILVCFLIVLSGFFSFVLADVSFESDSAKITISDKGIWKSIVDKSTDRELCSKKSGPIAVIYDENGKYRPVSSFKRSGNNCILEFKPADTVLTYSIEAFAEWFHFRLTIIEGSRPQRITFCQVPVNITENVGPLLNIAWDDQTSICLMGASWQPDCGPVRSGKDIVTLKANVIDNPGPPLEGTAVALIVCPTEINRQVIRRASHAFGLLINEDQQGVPSKETLGKRSYWFLFKLTEKDAPKIIEYCKKTNINQVLMGFGNWAKSAGHIQYNTKYFPDGAAGIRRLVKKLKDAGIGLGAHTFVSKVNKNDSYVTPIPDKRFWNDFTPVTLAEDIDEKCTTVKSAKPIDQWPGSPVCKKKNWDSGVERHQEFTLNDEIIRYKSIDPNTNTFLDCSRASYGTVVAAHKAGDNIHHWAWEGSNRYIIDQETNLIDETTKRMAEAFNECGFNMIYFDGGEDVPKDRFRYYASLCQYKTLKYITTKPFIHMGTAKTHRLWHSFTIGSTVDTYLNTFHRYVKQGKPLPKTCKEHIDRSVEWVIAAQKSLIPGEFGWFGIWPDVKRAGTVYEGLQLDQIEYVMTKCLAYDAPISLETSFAQMESNPLSPAVIGIVGAYEKMRLEHSVDSKTTDMLKETGKDYALIRTPDNQEFVRVYETTEVAGTHDVRAFVGQMENGDAVATIWHYQGKKAPILLPQSSNAKLYCFLAKELQMEKVGTDLKVPVDHRRLSIIFPKTTINEAKEILADAKFLIVPEEKVKTSSDDKSLVAHWTFDKDAKNYGFAGSVANGKLMADAAIIDDPQRGKVLALDGYGDAVKHEMPLPRQQGTIAHWIKPDGSQPMPIVYESDGDDGVYNGMGGIGLLEIHTATDMYRPMFLYQDGTSDFKKKCDVSLTRADKSPRKEWTHVAVTWTQKGDIVIYVNGKESRRKKMTTPQTQFENRKSLCHYIGRTSSTSDPRFFKGCIDDVRIYDRVLSADEISKLTKNDKATRISAPAPAKNTKIKADKSLLAYWPFDNDAKNLGSAGAIADGSLLADAVITDDPERGKVLTLDGFEDAVEHKMDLPQQKGTIAHWIRPLLSTKMPILFETNEGNQEIQTMLYRYKAVFIYHNGPSDLNVSGNTYLFNAGQTPRKEWSHIAVTYDRAGDIIIYVNGKEARRTKLTRENTKFESQKPTMHYIGRIDETDTLRYFKGSLDDVRIYDRVLSPKEIDELAKM